MENDFSKSFVFYESWYFQYEQMIEQGMTAQANEFLRAVMRFGLYGELPPNNSIVWVFGFANIQANIQSAQSKRKKVVPKEDLKECVENGMTQKEMAERFNCSIDTIQRRIKSYGFNNENLGF